ITRRICLIAELLPRCFRRAECNVVLYRRPSDLLYSLLIWSGRWDSNPRPQPWQGCALPLSYTRVLKIDKRSSERLGMTAPPSSYAKECIPLQPRQAGPMKRSMPATLDELFAFLDTLGIAHKTVNHPAVFTVEEARDLRGAIAGGHTKNLF